MSLLVDPEYFLHALKLNYLRKLPDSAGPSSISFSTPQVSSSTYLKESGQPDHSWNPYVQLSGLLNPQRWPELLVQGSPPEPVPGPINNINDQSAIRSRRRRAPNDSNNSNANQAQINPHGSSLKYSETIVGPKGGGLSAGMRVTGRKSLRNSRRSWKPLLEDPDKTNADSPHHPVASSSTSQQITPSSSRADSIPNGLLSQNNNPGAGALALTEGRTNVVPGGGLNPEDSDDDLNSQQQQPHAHLNSNHSLSVTGSPEPASHSRSTTDDTVKGHRRRISAVTFADQALSFTNLPSPGSNTSRHRTRASRVHSASSVATTNTVMSSDLSEGGMQTAMNSNPLGHHRRGSNFSINTDIKDDINYINEQASFPTHIRPRHRLDSKNNTGAYYSTAHDPDKRLSDMLFNYRPYEANRRTQIVGSVELEPAPLVQQDEDDETAEDGGTDQTDTETEQGDDYSSSNIDELEEDEELEDIEDTSSVKSPKSRRKRTAGSSLISSDFITTDDTMSSVGKSMLNTSAISSADANLLNRAGHNTSSDSLVPHPTLLENPNNSLVSANNQSPPIVRRRERRRVNIKMGKLLGPPIIEEESAGGNDLVPSAVPTAASVEQTAVSKRGSDPTHATYFAGSRPSLPDLRQAVEIQGAHSRKVSDIKKPHPADAVSSKINFATPNGVSPARPRSLTTPTPPTAGAATGDLNSSNSFSTGSKPQAEYVPDRSRWDLGTNTPRRRKSSQQQVQALRVKPSTINEIKTPNSNKSIIADSEPGIPTATKSSNNKPKRAPLVFNKIDLSDQKKLIRNKPKSILTELLTAQSSNSSGNNPFRCFYALLASKERNSLKLTIYFPFSKEPKKPIKTSMKSDVCVEEVVGFALWNYVEENREPKLGDLKPKQGGAQIDLNETQAWCLMLVEDDGEVDEDFPALERTRPAGKVGSKEFAIVMASEAQVKQNAAAQSQIQRRPSRVLGAPTKTLQPANEVGPSSAISPSNLLSPPVNTQSSGMSGVTLKSIRTVGGGVSGSLLSGGYGSMSIGGGSSFTGEAVYLKIRIPSPGRGVDSIITTMNVTMDMYLADVLETLCKRKSLGSIKEWALVVPSSPSIPLHQRDIIVPLDRTVESLQGVNSLALVKRSQISSKLLRNSQINGNLTSHNTNPSASIFKRLSEPPQPKYVSITDLTSTNRSFVIQTKRRGILGKQDRLLTIEDDYVHICPNNLMGGVNNSNGNMNNNGNSGVESGKTSSYHISQIVNCLLRVQQPNRLKLVVMRDGSEKRYDVEAENSQSAIEIVKHIKGLKEMYHTRN